MMEREWRVFDVGALEVREADGEAAAPQIAGYAAVYGRESENLGGFVEIIEPGFFDGAIGGDIRSLWNHNSDFPLGRTTNGTLALRQDENGLHTITLPPETQWGRDALTSIRRGDVTQMSFSFSTRFDGDKWEKREDGTVLRRLLPGGCERLWEVSPVTFPAYPDTRVSARAMDKVRELSGQGAGVETEANGQPGAGAAAARRRKLEIKKRGF